MHCKKAVCVVASLAVCVVASLAVCVVASLAVCVVALLALPDSNLSWYSKDVYLIAYVNTMNSPPLHFNTEV